jgi:hypothetical protein
MQSQFLPALVDCCFRRHRKLVVWLCMISVVSLVSLPQITAQTFDSLRGIRTIQVASVGNGAAPRRCDKELSNA